MQGALKIGRLQADCHVSGPEVAPAVVDQAARALRDHLADTLRRTFARWLDREDESVWIVRRVEFSVSAAADLPADSLAQLLASSLGHALGNALKGDGDGANTLRFPSRAAYLARFVVDAAAGVSWNRWYYAPFAGLKVLPSSAAIRTALVENPARGLAALATLDDRALASVSAALTAQDEMRALDAFTGTSAADGRTNADVFLAARAEHLRASAAGLSRGHLLFAYVRADPTLRSEALQKATGHMVEIAPSLGPVGAENHADETHTTSRESAAPPQRLGFVIAADATAREDLSQSLVPGTTVSTRFGGALLLIRELDELPWSSWTKTWPSAPSGTPSAMLKWLTVASCAGRARSHAAFEDGPLRALFGIAPDATIRDVVLWLRRVGAHRRRELAREVWAIHLSEAGLTARERRWLGFPPGLGLAASWSDTFVRLARIVLRAFARRLPGFAASTPRHLWNNFLAFGATLTCEKERIVVLCRRPPLYLMLSLTGMTRGSIAGRDVNDRPILLFPGE